MVLFAQYACQACIAGLELLKNDIQSLFGARHPVLSRQQRNRVNLFFYRPIARLA